MDVIINTECASVPSDVTIFTAQNQAALNLLVCLGYDPLNLPLADLLRSNHKLEGDWAVLSPIHWQASHNDALIVAAGNDLQLNENESKFWFKSLFDYLHADGMTLYYHDANTWLLRVTDKAPLNAKPVNSMINRSLMPELVQLDSTMYWQKFFTECQMFFASQPNSSLLNGIWVWGGSKLSETKAVPICADEHYLFMAQACSNNVTLYNPTVRLRDFQIILLNDFENLSAQHRQELLKIPAHWYWNNTAYIHNSRNWFIRIWRNLTHAH